MFPHDLQLNVIASHPSSENVRASLGVILLRTKIYTILGTTNCLVEKETPGTSLLGQELQKWELMKLVIHYQVSLG